MSYLHDQLDGLRADFPAVPVAALKAAMVRGVEAFAWYKDGTQYVGTTGTKRADAVAQINDWSPKDLLPYPWCHGAPTTADCVRRGYCSRNPGCGD